MTFLNAPVAYFLFTWILGSSPRMTRAVYLCLFYDHSLCLSRGLSSPPVEGCPPGRGGGFVPAGQWTPTFVGVTVVCGWESIFYVYCATVNRSNFKDPIPACAGMTSF